MADAARTEDAAFVALLRAGRQPWLAYAEQVEERGSALELLAAEQSTLFGEETERLIRDAHADIDAWEREGMRLLTVLDRHYPENLRTVHDRPAVLFVTGRLESSDARSIAVVGARRATSAGVDRADAIARHVVERGYTVASGLAAGIDTAAHTAALSHGGRTIAVIGTGLRRVYPPENAALQQRIATEGAVVSQFWPDSPPSRRSFPMRNATMSGLTLATVVVEAGPTSGSKMQARLALEHGRPVFLVDALLEQDWGRALAQRPGVQVISSPAQITESIERLISHDALVA